MKKYLVAMAALLLLAAGAYLYLDSRPQDAVAVISGTVTRTIPVGTEVEEGTELVAIRSLAGGDIAAARAPRKGKVLEVLAAPGDEIKKGVIVARIK